MPPATLSDLSIFGAMLAGFASSLHCVGMCGGISASLMMTLSPSTDRTAQIRVALFSQFGRILSYMLAGAVLAAVSSQIYLAVDREAGFVLLRWAGALTLVYIGLSVAGIAPQLAGLDRIGARVAILAGSPAGARMQQAGPLFAGMLWGFMPCGMVYAALFYAMLSADPVHGALIMGGFGLGTLPAILMTAFGAGGLMRLARRDGARLAVGLLIIAIGILSAAIPWRTVAALCGIPLD